MNESQYYVKYFVGIIIILKIRKLDLMEVTIIENVNDNTTSMLIKTEMNGNLAQLVELSLHFFYLHWEIHVKLYMDNSNTETSHFLPECSANSILFFIW